MSDTEIERGTKGKRWDSPIVGGKKRVHAVGPGFIYIFWIDKGSWCYTTI